MRPLLSICIPTYNRADYLKASLESLVEQERYDEIEVVISDNESTDNTCDICNYFSKKYNNISYYRNNKSLGLENHPIVLQRAKGHLRKLSNDTLIYEPGSINYILEVIKKYDDEKPVLFFLNQVYSKSNNIAEIKLKSIDEFLKMVSYNITWIASISAHDTFCSSECNEMRVYRKEKQTHIAQVPFLLEILKARSNVVVCKKKLFRSILPRNKNLTYGLFNVFYINFLEIVDRYIKEGYVERETYEYIRKDLLFNFFSKWCAQIRMNPDQFSLSNENLDTLLHDAYKDTEYYERFESVIRKKRVLMQVKRMVEKLHL